VWLAPSLAAAGCVSIIDWLCAASVRLFQVLPQLLVEQQVVLEECIADRLAGMADQVRLDEPGAVVVSQFEFSGWRLTIFVWPSVLLLMAAEILR
jgi:hypothetical protein